MMRKIILSFVLAFILAQPAAAQNYSATAGSGLTFGSKFVSSVNYPQIVFCDPATPSQCVGVNSSGQMTIANTTFAVTNTGTFAVQLNSTPSLANGNGVVPTQGGSVLSATNGWYGNILQGNAVLSATNPLFVSPATSASFTVAQPTAASLNATVVGTGTFAVQAAQSGTWNITNISGTVSLPTGAATSANQTNASAKTQIVDGSGNVIASTSNNLNVQCANCSGSGASASDAASFTAGTSTFAPAGGEYTSGGATACVTGHQCLVGITPNRAFLTDLSSQAGTAITSAPSAYGTAPTGNVIGVNAFVTNTNANGSAVSASSSPVVIASDQAAVATKAASGTYVAGSIADLAHGQGTMSASVPVAIASNQSVADPCMFQAKTNVPISTAAGTTALVTGVSGKKIYICSLFLVTPSAVSVSLAEGSSSTCGTSNQAAVIGVATNGTAANGAPFAANGGMTLGNGSGTVAATATAADYLCLFQSGTAQIAGNMTVVQQ